MLAQIDKSSMLAQSDKSSKKSDQTELKNEYLHILICLNLALIVVIYCM